MFNFDSLVMYNHGT